MSYFRKSIFDLDARDIEALVGTATEGADLEFKVVPHKNGKADLESFGKRIARAIVAFATAEGGTLVLGLSEERDSGGPNRAGPIEPVADCEEIADRLGRQMRDLIEPPIELLHVRAIPTTGKGGVIVIDVPRDRRWLHRVKREKDCVVRSGNEIRNLDMREINELVLSFATEPNRVRRQLSRLRRQLQPKLDILHGARPHAGFSLRLTAAPLAPISLPDVVQNSALDPVNGSVWFAAAAKGSGSGERHDCHGIWRSERRREPRLRSAVYEAHEEEEKVRNLRRFFFDAISREGGVNIAYGAVSDLTRLRPDKGENVTLTDREIIETLAIALWTIEAVRLSAGMPDVEFALELDLRLSTTVQLGTAALGSRKLSTGDEAVQYSVGPAVEFPMVINEVMTDFLHRAGFRPQIEWRIGLEGPRQR